jgi:hypothetical protein
MGKNRFLADWTWFGWLLQAISVRLSACIWHGLVMHLQVAVYPMPVRATR